MTANNKTTLQDIADKAGVSKATVSLVLSNHPRISETTRQKVLAIVDDLGYIYNRRAASLRTQKSYTIGLIVTDIANPFYAELTSGIEKHLKQHGYSLLLGTTSDDVHNQDEVIRTMLERDADGVLLVPAADTSHETINDLSNRLSVVLMTRYIEQADVDYIGIDNEAGASQAVQHLIENGHRRIAFVGGHQHSSARRDRVRGYTNTLQAHNIAFNAAFSITSPVSRQGGYDAIQRLLTIDNPPTAALCYNDVVAFGVMLGLRSAGHEAGVDFAVIGFDNVSEASLWSPPLTTIAANPQTIGTEAASHLLQRITDKDIPIQQVILPSRLIVRASSDVRL